jgi:protein-tyrosine phosphatase
MAGLNQYLIASHVSIFNFKEKRKSPIASLRHSFAPIGSIDDGATDWENSVALIRELKKLGFKKLITTPHIKYDTYRNDAGGIQATLQELKKKLAHHKIDIEIDAAAEYYLDEVLYDQLIAKERLLTFGKNYLLVETNFLSEPYQLKDFIFHAATQGYQFVLAHPERYAYMNMSKAEDLKNRGVLFQLNSISLCEYYSKSIQKLAHQLIDKGWVNFLGSDCHNLHQAGALGVSMNLKYYHKALDLPLLNNTL